jgi:putative oxidoreductase
MVDHRTASLAGTLLRLALGSAFLAHAALKAFGLTPAGTLQAFTGLGLPSFLFYLLILVESVGGMALLFGFATRAVSLALMPVPVAAIIVVQSHNGLYFDNPGGGWEYPAFWTMTLLVQALLGDGWAAIGHPRWLPLARIFVCRRR